MKVALVTSCYVPHDGVGNTVRDKLAAFGAWGWPARVYHQQDQDPPDCDARRLELADVVDERIRDDRAGILGADLVLLQYLLHYPLMDVARLLPGGRLVVEYPGITPPRFYPPEDPFGLMTAEALRHLDLLDRADAVMVHSEYMRSELGELRPSAADRIEVVPLGVGPAFAPGAASPELRGRWAPDGGPLLLYVGRLTANKRLDVLVSALAAFRRHHPRARLALVGEHGRATTGWYRRSLQAQAADLGVGDGLVFVGPAADDELARWYGTADVLVTASEHEGFCLPVAEAMTCGAAVVAVDAAAVPETLGGAGLLCPPGDHDALAAACRRVVEEAGLRAELGRRAREAAGRFSPEAYRARLKTFLEAVAARDPLPGRREASDRGLIEAAGNHSPRYLDRIGRVPLLGRLVSWFRRRVTLPLEVSCIRPLARQQTAWNRLMLDEVLRLRREVAELRRRLPPTDGPEGGA